MKRDWNKEWEQEREAVNDIVAMFEKYNACEHVWIEDKGEQVALRWVAHICVKCGGAMEVVDVDTWLAITGEEPEPLLPNDKRGSHCL